MKHPASKSTPPPPSAPMDLLMAALDKSAKQDRLKKRNLEDRIRKVRVHSKRVRALLEVFRPCITKLRYNTAKASIRDAVRDLSSMRDQDALHDTLTKRAARIGGQRGLNCQKWIDLTLVERSESSDASSLKLAAEKLRHAQLNLPRPAAYHGKLSEFVIPGLKETYAKARSAMCAAKEDGCPKHFHRWRQWTKRVLLQLRLFQMAGLAADPQVVKCLRRLQCRLGKHRDILLALEFASKEKSMPKILRQALRIRCRRLQNKLISEGKSLFSSKPREFVQNTLGLSSSLRTQG